MAKNEHWNTEEFEDLVARSLIAMYETKIQKYKNSLKSGRLNKNILERIKSMGCYFTANDRIVSLDINDNGVAKKVQQIDVINDGRPERAILCTDISSCPMLKEEDDMRNGSYMEISYLERINELPSPWKCEFLGRKYRMAKLWMKNKGLIEGLCCYFIIDSSGNIHGTSWTRENYNPVTGTSSREMVSSELMNEHKAHEDILTVDASVTIQAWQDRRYMWNVMAKEREAKATFTVYPEEIKSLFYSRELPMTETGRKRPILHWVASHQRRLKSGIDIDIEKHLRGTNEFTYNGTKFIITRPIKLEKSR